MNRDTSKAVRWVARLAKLAASIVTSMVASAAHAAADLGSVFGTTVNSDLPEAGSLAVVGMGLLVLSVFASRRRGP